METKKIKGQVFGDVINKELIREEYIKLGKPLGEPNPEVLKRWSHQLIDDVIDGKLSTFSSTNLPRDTTLNT